MIGLVSCGTRLNVEEEIEEQITEYYKMQEVKGYVPISYGTFDTLQITNKDKQKSMSIKGIVTHGYKGVDNNGDTLKFKDTFDVTIFKDVVVVVPRGF